MAPAEPQETHADLEEDRKLDVSDRSADDAETQASQTVPPASVEPSSKSHFVIRERLITSWSRSEAPAPIRAMWDIYQQSLNHSAPIYDRKTHRTLARFLQEHYIPWALAHDARINALIGETEKLGESMKDPENELPAILIGLEMHEQLRVAAAALPHPTDLKTQLQNKYFTNAPLMAARDTRCNTAANSLGADFVPWATECHQSAVRFYDWQKTVRQDAIYAISREVVDPWKPQPSQSVTVRLTPKKSRSRPSSATGSSEVISPWSPPSPQRSRRSKKRRGSTLMRNSKGGTSEKIDPWAGQ